MNRRGFLAGAAAAIAAPFAGASDRGRRSRYHPWFDWALRKTWLPQQDEWQGMKHDLMWVDEETAFQKELIDKLDNLVTSSFNAMPNEVVVPRLDVPMLNVGKGVDVMTHLSKIEREEFPRRDPPEGVETCKGCGCWEMDACWDDDCGSCWWVAPNLCSFCAPKDAPDPGEPTEAVPLEKAA